jgi:hypothetical protein
MAPITQRKRKELLPGIEIFGLTLWLKKEKTLIFADLHLGYEEELNALGFLIPRFQYKEILDYLEKDIFSKIFPERVIINGDLKHEFGRISEQEWQEVLGFLDFLEKKFCKNIVLIKGNHDTILGPLAERKELKIKSHFYFPKEKIYIAHGHKIPSKKDKDFSKAKILIIAHDHPALGLREGLRVEKVKCFLKGFWNGKVLIQIPSLNFVTEGADISQELMLSPFMKNIEEFEVYCIEKGRVFYFGRVEEISK